LGGMEKASRQHTTTSLTYIMKLILFLYSVLILVLIGSCAHKVQRDIERRQIKADARSILDTPIIVIENNKPTWKNTTK